mmetsp:Transcript_176708/g.566663  ORF Transcript_176708/g.566663 Transcript_176708/m.566663 type:complete len:551 (-) Transcript_176708:7039-8691(-)
MMAEVPLLCLFAGRPSDDCEEAARRAFCCCCSLQDVVQKDGGDSSTRASQRSSLIAGVSAGSSKIHVQSTPTSNFAARSSCMAESSACNRSKPWTGNFSTGALGAYTLCKWWAKLQSQWPKVALGWKPGMSQPATGGEDLAKALSAASTTTVGHVPRSRTSARRQAGVWSEVQEAPSTSKECARLSSFSESRSPSTSAPAPRAPCSSSRASSSTEPAHKKRAWRCRRHSACKLVSSGGEAPSKMLPIFRIVLVDRCPARCGAEELAEGLASKLAEVVLIIPVESSESKPFAASSPLGAPNMDKLVLTVEERAEEGPVESSFFCAAMMDTRFRSAPPPAAVTTARGETARDTPGDAAVRRAGLAPCASLASMVSASALPSGASAVRETAAAASCVAVLSTNRGEASMQATVASKSKASSLLKKVRSRVLREMASVMSMLLKDCSSPSRLDFAAVTPPASPKSSPESSTRPSSTSLSTTPFATIFGTNAVEVPNCSGKEGNIKLLRRCWAKGNDRRNIIRSVPARCIEEHGSLSGRARMAFASTSSAAQVAF